MKTKAERRIRHASPIRSPRALKSVDNSANREGIELSGNKAYKVVKADGKKYYIDLKRTK